MAPKRKRASILEESSSPRQRPRTKAQAPARGRGRGRPRKSAPVEYHPHGEVDPDQFYRIRSILDEDIKRYKIDWEDGPRGEHYEPTWEPKRNVNDAAIEEWETLKAERNNSSLVVESEPEHASEELPQSNHASNDSPQSKNLHASEELPQSKHASNDSPQSKNLHASDDSPQSKHASDDSPPIKRRRIRLTGKSRESTRPASSPEIPDSLSQTRPHGFSSRLHVSSAAEENIPAPARSRTLTIVQVQIPPPGPKQQLNYLPFSSSQIVSGTQTQQEEAKSGSPEFEEPSQSQSQSLPVDAAAAPDLTQKHSAFEPDSTSSSEEVSGSVAVTSNSGVHTLPVVDRLPYGTVIPDSQALNDSLSYAPSQPRSGEDRQSDQSQSQAVATATATTQNQISVDSQIVPESSVPQQLEPQEANAQQQISQFDEPDSWTVQVIEEHSSPVEEFAEEVQDPQTPGASASPSSSTSSPPPTESPDKSQSQSQSQGQSQSQSQSQSHLRFQSQVNLHNTRESPRPTQETIALDSFTTAPEQTGQVSPNHDTPLILPSVEHIGSPIEADLSILEESNPSYQQDSSSVHFFTQTLPPGPLPPPPPSYQQDSESSVHFLTQTFPTESLPAPDSSSIPSIPSQSLPVIGESAPVPPTASAGLIFSTPEPVSGMSNVPSTPTSSGSGVKARLKERMSAARAANRANAAAKADALKPASAVPARLQSPALQDREVRSPSMIPAVEAPVMEAPEDAFRSERFSTLLPGHELDAPLFGGVDLEPIEPASRDHSFRNVRYIPINFGEQQRDHYKQAVASRKSLIDHFSDKIWPVESSPAQNARKLLQQLGHVVLHPDLDDDETLTQPSHMSPRLQAQWDSDCSTKFRFLSVFLARSQQYTLSTVLLVHPGRIVSMLQCFLRGINVEFALASDPATASALTCPVIIVTTDDESVTVPSPDLIIALQGSITDETIVRFQSQLSRNNASTTPVPAYSLIVPKTLEHVERILPSYETEATRLHVLVATVAALRSEAGRDRDPDSGDAVEMAATQLVEFCLNPGEWPLEELPAIELWDPVTPSQASTDSLANGSLKRALDATADIFEESKKARIGPSSLEASGLQDVDASHVGDSMASQQALKALRDERDAFAQQARDAKAREQDHVRALEILQYDHEEQREMLAEKDAELDRYRKNAQNDAGLIESFRTKWTSVREECSELKKQLAEAREALLTQAIPERIELEKLRKEAETAAAECVKLRNKVKQAEENYDYLREQYQVASSAASQVGGENLALEAENAELQKKASGEQLKLRERTLDSATQALTSRVQELELVVKSRDELLMRKEEEIAKAKENRGRMNTRGSSVPRTPRVGSPLAQGTSSRQASPAAGKGPHPLRNAG